MKTPESILAAMLGDRAQVKVLGVSYDLAAHVAIPAGADIEALLHEHVERFAGWRRLLTLCRRAVERAQDELDDHRALRFTQYWATCEETERQEMQDHLHDERELVDEPFQRKARAKARLAGGLTKARWNRNFTDALIHSYVNSDKQTVILKTTLRRAKHELETALAVKDSLEHRARCLSHLAAIHRDDSRE